MKLSVFGEYSEFTVVGLTRTSTQNMRNKTKQRKRMRRMKLRALGVNSEWHKIESVSAKFWLK